MPHQPCPFCGGSPDCDVGPTVTRGPGDKSRYFAQAFCTVCGATGPGIRAYEAAQALDTAWKRWDMRVEVSDG